MVEYTEDEIKALSLIAKSPDALLHSLVLKRVIKILDTLEEQKVVVLSEHCAYTQPLFPKAKEQIKKVLQACGVIITGGVGGRGRIAEKLTARLKPEPPCEVCGVEEAEWTALSCIKLCPECMITHKEEFGLMDDDYKELPF